MKCGSSFECQENESCWCSNESKLSDKEITYDDCVCKNCLLLQYKQKIIPDVVKE
jgi:hypothetical protein